MAAMTFAFMAGHPGFRGGFGEHFLRTKKEGRQNQLSLAQFYVCLCIYIYAPYCKAIRYFVKDTTVRELNGCMSCHFGTSFVYPPHPTFSLMEETVSEGGKSGTVMEEDLVEAAVRIEAETARALDSLADGGALVALGQLRGLVEQSQRPVMEVVDLEGPEETEERYSPTTVNEVEDKSELDQLAVELNKDNKRLVTTGTVEASEVMADMDDVLESELKRLRPTVPKLLTMPWETGFAGMVLGGSEVSLVPSSVRMGPLMPTGKVPEVEEVQKIVEEAVEEQPVLFPRRKKDGQRRVWKLEEEDRRSRAKTSWLVIVRAMGEVTPVHEMIEAEGEGVLDDIFARKKTGTLEVRASAMLLYIRWCGSKGFQAFPCTEPLAYDYVAELRKNNAPATRANSFRSALAFCKGSMMIDGVDTILSSSRVTGSAHRSYLTKRMLKQRDALTVDQVRILENVLEVDGPIQDKIFAAHCLLCIYGRLRFGDHQNIQEEPTLEDGFIECGLSVHKTENLAGRARRILPVVAPSMGVSGLDWGNSFLKLRQAAALRAWPQIPFLPAPILGGGWSMGKLSTTEVSMWLCELLHKYGVAKEKLTNVGAHLMKATALSWMAKAGMEPKLRRLMGYHIKPKDTSVVLYSRDALGPGLEKFSKIIEQIKNGHFRPDASRSGRWMPEETKDPAEEEDASVGGLSDDDEILDVEFQRAASVSIEDPAAGMSVERLAVEENQSSESEEEDKDQADTEDERNAEKVVAEMVGPPKRATEDLYRHRLTGTVHKGSSVENKLACGRMITALMIEIDEPVHAVHSMCKVCMGYRRS